MGVIHVKYCYATISFKSLLTYHIQYKQKNHHKKMSFKDEYRNFLNNYNIDYDERYVWDSIFLACARFGAGGWFDFISHRALLDVVGWRSFGAVYNINLELND